jgi:holliday junction DNA helicase RuvB
MSEPTDEERLLSGQKRREDGDQEQSLRPQFLGQVIGQDRVVDNLKILVSAAKTRKESLDHLLFYGPPGIGKTTLSTVMGKEMGVNVRPTAGPAIERAGDLAAILTHLRAGDILFIDEIHRLGKAVGEILYPAMEDFVLDIVVGKGPAAKNVRLKLPRFTVIGATTRLALLTSALRSRFGAIYRLDFYDVDSMVKIVTRAAQTLKVEIDAEGALEVARRGRGTPRIALRLLRRVRDFAQVHGQNVITQDIADAALTMLEVDALGLDDIDRRVLRAVIERGGGPVGLEMIAAAIGEEADTIMDVCEPYLIQLGFLDRTPRGRTVTAKAYQHLGLHSPRHTRPEQDQLPLLSDDDSDAFPDLPGNNNR